MAAIFNLIGALLGETVAKTIGSGIIDPGGGNHGLTIIFAGLIGAIVWNLITWWFGLPSSSSHALIGGLMGAGIASATEVHWGVIGTHVAIPMVVSPLIGFVLAYFIMVGVLWICRNKPPARAMRRFRIAQIFSAASRALGHGPPEGQATTGGMLLGLADGRYG